MNRINKHCFQWLPILLLTLNVSAQADTYNPLAVDEHFEPKQVDLTVKDSTRGRDIPIRVYLPAAKEPATVVLFSHGLGGSCKNNPYLGNHWARRGYVAVFMQHIGSDESVWKDVPMRERMSAMRKAASAQNYMLRVKDVPAVIDQLQVWNADERSELHNRMNLDRVGMSGHSFGAITTQAVSGQTAPRMLGNLADHRIVAAIPMSPSIPRMGNVDRAFGDVKIPWLLMTGTHDESIIGNSDAASRLEVYPALPAGSKYELVLHNAEHSVFGERRLPGESMDRNPNHHRVILALSTAFWDAYLLNDADARVWLDGEGARSVMEAEDRWQRK